MRYIVSVLLLCIGMGTVQAQDVYTSSGKASYNRKKEYKQKGFDPSRLIIGGGLTAGFAGGYIDAGVSPFVGYKFTDRFAAGVGLGYEYFRQPLYNIDPNNPNTNYYSHSNVVYPSVWARFFVWKNLFVSANFEYDFINFNGYDYAYDATTANFYVIKDKMNVTVPCLLPGIGLKEPIGGRASVVVEALYDVLQQQYSPYFGQPVFRVGFCVGL